MEKDMEWHNAWEVEFFCSRIVTPQRGGACSSPSMQAQPQPQDTAVRVPRKSGI
jgi:hypothetical protein